MSSQKASDFTIMKKHPKQERNAKPAKRRSSLGAKFPVYDAPAMGCIPPENCCRRNAIKLVHSQAPFRCEASCTLRGIMWPLVKCGLIPAKHEAKKIASFASLMLPQKSKTNKLDYKLTFLWTFDRTIIALILMNCLFLSMTKPFPTCCRAGAESKGESTELITASFFAIDLGTVQNDNSGLGHSESMLQLHTQPSGNKTALRCVMGAETMVNVLEYRNELVEGEPVTWHPTTPWKK